MRQRLLPVYLYAYYLPAEVPDKNLRAREEVIEADDLFEDAMAAYKSAGGVLMIGSSSEQKRIEALDKYQQIVHWYPTSDKIGRSAFHIAEIYRDFDQFARAAVWYDRAFQWDPALHEPARYRAARLYDFDLNDDEKAMEYYALALRHEAAHKHNAARAKERLAELRKRR